MKKVKLNIPFLIATIIILFTILSGFHNPDATPHGGKVIEATDGYHIERVMELGKKVTFYLLDKDAKSTIKNHSLSGSANFTFKNKAQANYELKKRDDESLLLKMVEKCRHIECCIVTINYNGKPITAKFNE